MKSNTVLRKPDWLRLKIRSGESMNYVQEILEKNHLTTVCEEANCPNRMECFSSRTATFMILGSRCTRNCTFCDVMSGKPDMVDPDEPIHIADAVSALGLNYVVVTSVTRDDLPDGGSQHFAKVIQAIHGKTPEADIEVLIPDFKGDTTALQTVIEAGPVIINHNIETVPRLYSEVRPQAVYLRSLELLRKVKELSSLYSKSGLMVGLGETYEEVVQSLHDLREVDCDFLTIGQYLAPSKKHHPVVEYIHPDIFAQYKEEALAMGFKGVASGPLVRSSYKAHEMLKG